MYSEEDLKETKLRNWQHPSGGKERNERDGERGGDRSPRRGSHSWLPVNCPNKNVRAASASFFFFFLSFSRGSRAIAWAPP